MDNEKIELTEAQQNCGLAKATDFVIEDRDGGQRGDSKAERTRLLKKADHRAKTTLGTPIADRNDVNRTARASQ
jgi:hypothetical protein